MPQDCCHPIAAHQKLRIPDTYVSSLMLDRALDALARRVGSIDREHDIPYLAGYSLDGKRIYIDRHLPPTFRYRGRDVAVDRYLLLHEEVEKALIDHLDLHYQHAHQIATRAEEAAVRADGVSWRAYDRFMQAYVKTMGDERLTKLPDDLDLKPYRDEHDYRSDAPHGRRRGRSAPSGARRQAAAPPPRPRADDERGEGGSGEGALGLAESRRPATRGLLKPLKGMA